MCSAFIIYGSADSRNAAAINFFVKYPLSAGMARRTDGKHPADRCDHAALAEHIAQQWTQVHNDNSMGINSRKDEETMDNQGGVPKWK